MDAPELRWTLLLLGVLFLAGLFWWELRRPRRARGADPQHPEHPLHLDPPLRPHYPDGVRREPVLTLPPVGARDPLLDLPTIEVPEDPAADVAPAVDVESGAGVEPKADVEGQTGVEHHTGVGFATGVETETGVEPQTDVETETQPSAPPVAEPDVQAHVEPTLRADVAQPASERTARPAWRDDSPSDTQPDPVLEPSPVPVLRPYETPAEPVVDWPEEGARRIVALRLVAAVDRFPGHIVRQALTAEGFVLGKLSIFHRAGPDGRAVVSAASLNPPGSFDPESIDRQRLGGLSLFAVLPGPLPATRAFDELLASARNLNDRLQGQLQDERGAPLTPLRAAEMREGLGTLSKHEG